MDKRWLENSILLLTVLLLSRARHHVKQHSLVVDRQEMKEREARSTLGLPVTLSAAATFEIDSAGTVLNSYAVATAAVSS